MAVPEPFVCPSDPEISYRVKTNYDFVVHGSGGREWYTCRKWVSRTPATRTMFEEASACAPQHVNDGLSNTIAMAETWRNCCCDGANADWAQRGYTQIGLSLIIRPPNSSTRWMSWWTPPDDCWNRYGGQKLGDYCSSGSWHPGGLNIVLGDSSVRFLSQTADSTLRSRLSVVGDGQVLGDY